VGTIAAAVVFAVGADLAALGAAAVVWAAGGATLTLLEELARGRTARRLPAAVAFGVLTPSIASLAGAVAWAAARQGQLPVAALEGLIAGSRGRPADLLGVAWITGVFFFPGVAFAAARLRGDAAFVPAAWAGLAGAAVVFVLVLVGGREPSLVLVWPLATGIMTSIIALLAAGGLVVGRALEGSVLRMAAREDEAGR